MKMLTETKDRIRRPGFWLMLLLAAQSCLDVLAYWTRNETATPAGIIRLVLLVALPAAVLLTTRRKKAFFCFLLAAGGFCLLHILNSWKHGYISPVTDIRYLAGVMQMPVFAVCFLLLIREEETWRDALRGVWIGAVLTLLFLILARLTNTGNVTYGEGLGYSGWVIDENRNANSTNLVIYACFSLFLALYRDRRWLSLLVPVAPFLRGLSADRPGPAEAGLA